ncbi:MAG: hypothetical protein J6N18_00800 [Kiritimatiellae bacterium]|nr:hypothetical protein [Kiritimatiellia bacterium]
MKYVKIVLCVLFMLCAVSAAQKSTAKKTSFSESELRTLAKAAPDVKIAGQLYSVALATSNDVDRQQEYLKTSAAGLIACGEMDVYKKHIKGKLQNAAEFEDMLKGDCEKCSGQGARNHRCYTCSGNGKCSRCKGSGQTVSVGFDNNNESKTCRKCNGSGHCQKCSGAGSTNKKCLACAGTGRTFSKTVATMVFRDSCNTIADGVDIAATSNKADVNSNGKVDFAQQHTAQNVDRELSQRRSRRGHKGERSVRERVALPASSGCEIDNELLVKLKDFKKQHRYRLEDVVSVGKAVLSTSKVTSRVISGTPFYYNSPGNNIEFRKEVRTIVKSAQTLLSDVEANEVEILRGEFNPDGYVEYWHEDTTEIRKCRLFDEIWEKALYSPHVQRDANNNPLGRVLLTKAPDNMVFVVDDVSLVELKGGGKVYCVELTALVFGEENRTLEIVWNGREYQTKRYVELAKKAGVLAGGTVRLLVPTSHRDVEKWKKGDTVISKGWLSEWNIINAVRTYGNGGKEEYRKIEMSGEMFRSFRDFTEMNSNISL